ncbi:MAG TPA: hypothetical protein VE783_02095 [Candidatus Limnocylindrales bacterium]|jgi:hypothetical protein|nr:hypothetical protein [Candidatus Limnocylindrales bacterium]
MPFPQKKQITNDEILAAIKDCAEKLGRAPSTDELKKMTGGKIDRAFVARRLGNYTRALEICGLKRHDKAKPRTIMELFVAWATAARRLKRMPTFSEMTPEAGISAHCYLRKFSKWTMVRDGMRKFMEDEKLEGEWADVADLIRKSAPKRFQKLATALPIDTERIQAQTRTRKTVLETGLELVQDALEDYDRPLYGDPINHPCMLNAPTNEDGVLGLFVAMARDLGFIVTRVQRAFPDIEALRKMKGGRWRMTRIELEFESRSFVAHGHDPKGCDLIVCWVHNWPECPVPVIELSKFF